jgi:hypothetical protein
MRYLVVSISCLYIINIKIKIGKINKYTLEGTKPYPKVKSVIFYNSNKGDLIYLLRIHS